jgi:hypothetical protein
MCCKQTTHMTKLDLLFFISWEYGWSYNQISADLAPHRGLFSSGSEEKTEKFAQQSWPSASKANGPEMIVSKLLNGDWGFWGFVMSLFEDEIKVWNLCLLSITSLQVWPPDYKGSSLIACEDSPLNHIFKDFLFWDNFRCLGCCKDSIERPYYNL